MTERKEVTGPPIALNRPAGQPTDLPKEGNTRVVELPQGKPRHDQPRDQTSAPSASKPEAETSTVPPASSDETGGSASAHSIAPTRKVLAAGAGGGGIGVPLAVILSYHLELPTEIAVAYSGLLVALLSFLAGYLVPAER